MKGIKYFFLQNHPKLLKLDFLMWVILEKNEVVNRNKNTLVGKIVGITGEFFKQCI